MVARGPFLRGGVISPTQATFWRGRPDVGYGSLAWFCGENQGISAFLSCLFVSRDQKPSLGLFVLRSRGGGVLPLLSLSHYKHLSFLAWSGDVIRLHPP